MQIGLDLSAWKQLKWHDYVLRFFFGGLITAGAGLVAKRFGPAAGGLFLAFPAIFPASATLIEKHETEKKRKAGMAGERQGRAMASVDAAGTAMGTIGLAGFAFLVWRLLPSHGPAAVLGGASMAWLCISVLAWAVRKLV